MFKSKKFIAAASSLALAGSLAVAAPASANGGGNIEQLENATFNWKVSDYALDQLKTQITAPGNLTGDVTFDSGSGFTFTDGTGTRDKTTGDLAISYTGSFAVGKTNAGCYKTTITNPTIITQGDTGYLKADVGFSVFPTSGPSCAPGSPTATSAGSQQNVKILDFDNVDATENALTASTASDSPEGAFSSSNRGNAGFDEDFTEFLDTSSPSQRAHFVLTGNGTPKPNPNPDEYDGGIENADYKVAKKAYDDYIKAFNTNTAKQAQPISAGFDVKTDEPVFIPKVELVGATGIAVNKTKTITVKGTGFDPQVITDAGAPGLYVFFGPDFSTLSGGLDNSENQKYLYSAANPYYVMPNAEGEFTAKINVAGIYTAGGKKFDARKTALGVSLFGAHGFEVTEPGYETFTQVRFGAGAVSYSKPGKVKNAKRVKTSKKAARVAWKAPTATSVEFRNNKAVYYQVRSTNRKGKKFGKWKKVSSRSFTFKNLKKGKYKFQIRAVSKAGAGSAVTLKYTKRK